MNVLKIKRLVSIGLALAATVAVSSANADAYRNASIQAHSTKVFTYTAEPGETFFVRIRGDGDTDVDLKVRSPSGETACSSLGATDRERCTVFSPYGGSYRIELRNRGDVYNNVELWLI